MIKFLVNGLSTEALCNEQGSGVGPTFYVVMESDLKPLSSMNLLCKFADDTNLLVPANSDRARISAYQAMGHVK